MDGGAWWAKVHGVAKSGTRLSDFTSLHFTPSSSWNFSPTDPLQVIISLLPILPTSGSGSFFHYHLLRTYYVSLLSNFPNAITFRPSRDTEFYIHQQPHFPNKALSFGNNKLPQMEVMVRYVI